MIVYLKTRSMSSNDLIRQSDIKTVFFIVSENPNSVKSIRRKKPKKIIGTRNTALKVVLSI